MICRWQQGKPVGQLEFGRCCPGACKRHEMIPGAQPDLSGPRGPEGAVGEALEEADAEDKLLGLG